MDIEARAFAYFLLCFALLNSKTLILKTNFVTDTGNINVWNYIDIGHKTKYYVMLCYVM